MSARSFCAFRPVKLPKHPPVPGGGFKSRGLNFFEGSDPLGHPLAKE